MPPAETVDLRMKRRRIWHTIFLNLPARLANIFWFPAIPLRNAFLTAVSLKTPLVKYRKGEEECPLSMNIPMVSAIMQSVSGEKLAIASGTSRAVSPLFTALSPFEDEAAMVRTR